MLVGAANRRLPWTAAAAGLHGPSPLEYIQIFSLSWQGSYACNVFRRFPCCMGAVGDTIISLAPGHPRIISARVKANQIISNSMSWISLPVTIFIVYDKPQVPCQCHTTCACQVRSGERAALCKHECKHRCYAHVAHNGAIMVVTEWAADTKRQLFTHTHDTVCKI